MGVAILSAEEWAAVAVLREQYPEALGVSIDWRPGTDRITVSVEVAPSLFADYRLDGAGAIFIARRRTVGAAA